MKIELEISRVYEIYTEVQSDGSVLSFEDEINKAKEKAINLFAEEMIYFEDAPEDFVSVKIKNIS